MMNPSVFPPPPSPDESSRWESEWLRCNRLTRSRGHICVRRLALGRCGTNWLGRGPKPGCSGFKLVFDHAALYLRNGVPAVIVGHEYGCNGQRAVERAEAFIRTWPQLELGVSGESWHYPGKTFLIVPYNPAVTPDFYVD